MLAADFFHAGDQLFLELNDSNQKVTAVSLGTTYQLSLDVGQWSGSNDAFVSGAGTSVLTVSNVGRSQFESIRIDDNAAANGVVFGDSGSNSYTEDFIVFLDRMDAGEISFLGETRFDGDAGLNATTTNRILLNQSGTLLEAEDGDLVLSANQQADTRDFSGHGIAILESTIVSTGLGNISMFGKGGIAETDGSSGILIINGFLPTVIQTQFGDLTLNGVGGGAGDSTHNFGVHVGYNSRVGSAGTGNVTIVGQGGFGSGIIQVGVSLNGEAGLAEIFSHHGNLEVVGTGGDFGESRGVLLFKGGSVASTGLGNVSVTGTAAAINSDAVGVEVIGLSNDGNRSQIRASAGSVSVSGYGGGGQSSGDSGNHGVYVVDNGLITAGGSGTVTVEGRGGPSAGNNNSGVYLINAGTITSSGGDISVTGVGGGLGTSRGNHGVFAWYDGQIVGTGSANVSVTGIGGNGSGGNHIGVGLNGEFGSGRITAVDGDITIVGQGGGEGGSSDSDGLELFKGGEIRTTGTGGINITGTGGSGTGSGNYGVLLYLTSEAGGASRIVSAGGPVQVFGYGGGGGGSEETGSFRNAGVVIQNGSLVQGPSQSALTIDGYGGTASGGAENYGIYIGSDSGAQSQVISTGGSINLNGVGGGLGASAYNFGVWVHQDSHVQPGGEGLLNINGSGGNTDGFANHGVLIDGNGVTTTVMATEGEINILGQGGISSPMAVDSTGNRGVVIRDGAIVTGTAIQPLRITGVGGFGNAGVNDGVFIYQELGTDGLATVTSQGGSVYVTGTGGQGGSWNSGVRVSRGLVTTGGIGSLNIDGTGGQSSGEYNFGLYVGQSGEIKSGGDISVMGIGGGIGDSDSNFGVHAIADGQIVGEGDANLFITGIGGKGTGGNHVGLALNGEFGYGRITAVDGDITIFGQGGGEGGSLGNAGVDLRTGGEIRTTGSGGIFVEGIGGDSDGGGNHGVMVTGTSPDQTLPSNISAGAGVLQVDGRGTIGLSSGGVLVLNGGLIQGSGTNSTTIVGIADDYGNGVVVDLESGSIAPSIDSAGGDLIIDGHSLHPLRAGVYLGASSAINAAGNLSFTASGATFESTATALNLIGSLFVGGDLLFDVSSEVDSMSLVDAEALEVAGGLTYLGGVADDQISMGLGSVVGGNIELRMGDGNNAASILGTLGGTSVKYIGGNQIDDVTLGTTGTPANVNVKLKSGNDSFHLNADAAIATNLLRVDFGGDDDLFSSDYGPFDFNARFFNLDGYNTIYDVATGNLDITQVSDFGDVVIDNSGPNHAIRFGIGQFNTLTPATDLRLILLSNTSTNVTADFDNPRVGNTVIQLRSGDRTVDFTGDSNTYTGLLRVEASEGVQTVNATVTTDLNVDGTFIFNGRVGSDALVAAHGITISEAMLLRGVNSFVNNAGVNVGGDFNVITLTETEDTRLISNASFEVGGNLTYLGGGGVDEIDFGSTGAAIGGFTYANLADATDPVRQQRMMLTGGFSTNNLVVDGGETIAGIYFTTDADTVVNEEVIVNFTGSSAVNTANFYGTYLGGYGTYRGGSGSDFVTLGATATDMLFAALTTDGDDLFVIDPGTDVDYLYIDFGLGNDTLDNQLGDPLPFDHKFINL